MWKTKTQKANACKSNGIKKYLITYKIFSMIQITISRLKKVIEKEQQAIMKKDIRKTTTTNNKKNVLKPIQTK